MFVTVASVVTRSTPQKLRVSSSVMAATELSSSYYQSTVIDENLRSLIRKPIMPIAPNQQHLHPETLSRIKKAKKPPKKKGPACPSSKWIRGASYKQPTFEELKTCPF